MVEQTVSARYDTLGELLRDVALRAGLRFTVAQVGDELVFTVLPVVDRSGEIRLDISNRGLTAQKVALQAPDTTRVIVAGQGEGDLRTILEVSTTDSETAQDDWGRVIEAFKDQRQTDDTDQLTAAGEQDLLGAGSATSVTAIPADETTMLFGVEWGVGDIVTAVVEDQETVSTVTEATIVTGSKGTRVGFTLGDPLGFDASRALKSQIESTTSRVTYLERTVEAGAYEPAGTAATLVSALDYTDVGAAPTIHTHAWSDITSGVPDFVAGTATLTVGTTAPSTPTAGDVWIDTTAGVVLKVWDGSAWQS